MLTADLATREIVTQRCALLPTIGRISSQCSVDALSRRTPNVARHDETGLEIQSREAEGRGSDDRNWVGIESVAGDTALHAVVTNPVHAALSATSYILRRPAQTSS